jgi:hypothetical protein
VFIGRIQAYEGVGLGNEKPLVLQSGQFVVLMGVLLSIFATECTNFAEDSSDRGD